MHAAGCRPQQAASGVFFRTAVLDYRLNKDVFPTGALSLFAAADPRENGS